MKFGQARGSASPADHPDRRLIGGLLVSLLLHGLVLLLRFGVPGLGLPGAPPPLTVRLAAVASPSAPQPPLSEPDVVAAPAAPAPQRQATGMQMLDPAPAPPVPSPPPKAAPLVRKDKPRRAKRISTPLATPETLVDATPVISQDNTLNEFKVPVARPEEAEQKSIDIKEARHGEDDGDASTSAAQEAAAAKAGKLKAEEDARLAREAEKQAAQEEQLRQAALAQEALRDEAQRRAEQRQKTEQETARLREQQQAQQKAEQQQLEQQKAEQLKLEAKKTEQQAAERQRAEQLKLEQQKTEQAKLAQQKLELQKLEQQKTEQLKLEQQKAEQAKLAQQKAEQQRAEQQKAEQQKAEQQKAEQAAAERQRAERAAAERAAADQRGRELAAAQPGIAGQGGPASGTGTGGGTVQIPKNMLGSDLGNRARDLVKGLDVLRGTPPSARRPGDRRVAVGFNERDLPLKMYVESWRQKIERNGALNYPRSWADAVRIDPLVSVAVRSDGTVEDVVIVSSSGRADMDEAVRRIVRVNARYSPFPPQIAERYDVIEIRRVWRFDDALKLMEELH